ncbi:hypothetical protein PILCRDRAFT_96385 [Piloderma croceum F 1598]|uniref:Phosphatidylinositol N-acetylglucosaminyltransferase n=1 Tax=Piloderma croceum (strain F 1598) TaxID=765440 RepID=A0A0C3FZS2_PILCF|nr:hypothetical protein PILCRDRAFT_96385 [Piloderma croceum F 1598]
MSAEEWEKVLWKTQSYPDNHIPARYFLASLRKNPNFRPYTYWPLVLASCAITQHLATIYIFLAVFVRLKECSLDPRILVWITVACFIGGYLAWELLNCSRSDTARRNANGTKTLKSSILVFLALMALSPVLKTLTAATSSDSIWALSAFLFMLNALLADYSPAKLGGQVRERLTSVLSMNAAISSSVVLGSRLSDGLAVFALILFSVQAFALFPMLRQRLQATLTIFQALLTLLLSLLSICLTASLSATVSCIYAATLVAVTFVAPGILVWAQKYKNEIRGPWDVAVPKVN